MHIQNQDARRFAKLHDCPLVSATDNTVKITPPPACAMCAKKFKKKDKMTLVMDVANPSKEGSHESTFVHEHCAKDLPFVFKVEWPEVEQ